MSWNLAPAVVAGAASRAVSILLRFFAVPLTLSLLTVEQYGLWMIISSTVIWFAFSDLGIPAALQNQLVMILQTGNGGRARALVAYALRMIAGIAAGIFVLVALGLWILPWEAFLKVEVISSREFAGVFLACLSVFALGLPTRLGGVVFTAHGRLNALPLSELIAQVASFVLLVVAVVCQWKSLLALVACSLVSVALVPLVFTWLAFRRFGYRAGGMGKPEAADRRVLLGQGGFFFATTIGELLILQSDALLVGGLLGAAFVPLFMIPAALFLNFLQAQNIFLRPLWPMLSKTYVEGNSARFSALVRRTFWISLAGGLVFGAALLLAGDWFVRLWSKGVAGLPPLMAGGFAAYVVVASVDNMLAMVLNAAGLIAQRFRYTLCFGVAKLIVGWWVLVTLGIAPLPLAYALVMLATSVPFAAVCVLRLLREMPARSTESR